MFCPQCATPNADGSKFCRSCGLELEPVALVLSGAPVLPGAAGEAKDERLEWLTKQTKSIKDITGGSILILVSLLLGCALALFVPADVPWIFVWVGLFGWMACWGGIELANGIGNLIESKGRLRLLELQAKESAGASVQHLAPARQPLPGAAPAALRLTPPASITEGTTRHLEERVES
jgi:hypothetical protein